MTIELRHGLANRLCTLASTLAAARQRGREMCIIWPANEFCGAPVTALFENAPPQAESADWIDFNDDTTFRPAFLSAAKTMFYEDPYCRWFQKPRKARPFLHNLPFFSGSRDAAAVAFSQALKSLNPTSAIRSRLAEQPQCQLGFHIRRTDSPWQSRSPLDAFASRIRAALDAGLGTPIYVASDDPAAIASLIRMFGSRIVTQRSLASAPRSGRDTDEGGKQALVDLLALARCNRIGATFNSSFSWLAAMWGGAQLEVVTSDRTR